MDAVLTWFDWRLRSMLPDSVRTSLLRACLEPEEIARPAWAGFAEAVGNPKAFFEDEFVGIKALLPLIARALDRNGIDPGPQFMTYARVALVREELRNRIYREVLESTLSHLEPFVSRPLVLRGLALAEACYDEPAQRHNHGIELLVEERSLADASRALVDAGYTPEGNGFAGAHRCHRHKSGLPVTLHSRLFEMPHLGEPAGIRHRAVEFAVADRTLATLAPADQLVHVCGHAAYSRSRANLRWVCDAVLLIRRWPDLDWPQLVAGAAASRLALPLAVAIRYLADHFDVAVPSDCVSELYRQCDMHRPRERAAAQAIALECPPASGEPALPLPLPARLRMLSFRSLPSSAYMRWKYGATGLVSLSRSYFRRGLGFLNRRLRVLPGAALR